MHPITSIALKKRLMEKACGLRLLIISGGRFPTFPTCCQAVRRLELVGDAIDANEAQRPLGKRGEVMESWNRRVVETKPVG